MNVEARQDFTRACAPGALFPRAGVALESMALEMPAVEGHPNRVRFHGVLTVVDAPSDKPPSGSRGHRVLLTGRAVEEAIPSLLGMAVDYTPSLDWHDARAKIGVITSAELEPLSPQRTPDPGVRRVYRGGRVLLLHSRRQQLQVSGYLFAKDFPEVVRQMQARGRNELGMSYEIADVHVADVNAPVWEVTKFTFTGAAVLQKSKAAYQNTWIEVEDSPKNSSQLPVPSSQ
ncbi:MAG: hypothetical protein ABSD88_02430 [Candidatus Korobacteraceae bacterium]